MSSFFNDPLNRNLLLHYADHYMLFDVQVLVHIIMREEGYNRLEAELVLRDHWQC